MKIPLPPFAWPIVVGFLVAVFCAIYPPKFPLLGLSSHTFYGFLFLGFALLAVLVGVVGWLRERARDRKRTAA